MADQSPLFDVTTDELLAELYARCDAALVIYCQKANDDTTCYRYHGNRYTCLGMAEAAAFEMKKKISDQQSDPPEPPGDGEDDEEDQGDDE
jgi:hypothetical protein